MRKKLYDILSGEDGSSASFVYACVMVAFIVASLIPLCFHERYAVFNVIELVCVVVSSYWTTPPVGPRRI